MAVEYIYITGQDGELLYEFSPTSALLNFLQRMAEDEGGEQNLVQHESNLREKEEISHQELQ